MRIPLPAGRMEQALPVRGPAQGKTTRGTGGRRGRAVPTVRNRRVQVPGLRNRHERSDLLRGLVLQPAWRRRKPDQRGQQRCRTGADPTAPTSGEPCIEIYAPLASATESATSARGSAELDFQESDETAKLELTYSTTASISRAGPALGTLIVCIIQVQGRLHF